MNATQHPVSHRATPHRLTPQILWAALSVAVVAALAVTAITQFAPAPKPAPAPLGQTVPDAASQGVASYLRAHRVSPAANAPGVTIRIQVVPDAASQGVSGYLRAHGVGQPQTPSVDRSFHTPTTSNYPGRDSHPQPQPTPIFKY